MAGTYSFESDANARLVRATLTGFFSLDDVAAFARAEQAAVRSLGLRSGEFDLLICTPGGQAQAQDVIGAFQRLAEELPLKARRIALVSESSLLRLQLRRVVRTDRAGVFESSAAAAEWLGQRSA